MLRHKQLSCLSFESGRGGDQTELKDTSASENARMAERARWDPSDGLDLDRCVLYALPTLVDDDLRAETTISVLPVLLPAVVSE
jgi:hypothetical protein